MSFDASLDALEREGLLEIGPGAVISPHAIFEPADLQGIRAKIVVGARCRVLPGAILYGGVTLDEGAVVEEHTVVGKPEHGYAVGKTYSGEGAPCRLAAGAVLRSGAVVYGGVTIGENTVIGHRTLLRSFVTIGRDTLIGHGLTIERETRIGDRVRCSPLSHLTSQTVLEDRVFLGAGILTINDKGLIWRHDRLEPDLQAPHFELGSRIGSGTTVAAGVRVGREALVGSGSLLTKDVPPFAIAYGSPASVRGTIPESDRLS
jgi:acetyltransferase-like isoleucine patch superfamily enzyme